MMEGHWCQSGRDDARGGGREGGDRRYSREGEAHVRGGIEAFVDDGVVPSQLQQDCEDRPGDAAASDDDFCAGHGVGKGSVSYGSWLEKSTG